MDAVPNYLQGNFTPDSVSFDLLEFQQNFHLCQAGYKGKDGKLMGKGMSPSRLVLSFAKALVVDLVCVVARNIVRLIRLVGRILVFTIGRWLVGS